MLRTDIISMILVLSFVLQIGCTSSKVLTNVEQSGIADSANDVISEEEIKALLK